MARYTMNSDMFFKKSAFWAALPVLRALEVWSVLEFVIEL